MRPSIATRRQVKTRAPWKFPPDQIDWDAARRRLIVAMPLVLTRLHGKIVAGWKLSVKTIGRPPRFNIIANWQEPNLVPTNHALRILARFITDAASDYALKAVRPRQEYLPRESRVLFPNMVYLLKVRIEDCLKEGGD